MNRLTTAALLATGAFLWITGGIVIFLRPAGHPPQSFRDTLNVMPFFGLGILMIGIGIYNLAGKERGLLLTASRILLFSSISYATGSLIRTAFIPGKWEALMPLGFIGSAIGLLLYGIAARKRKLWSSFLSLLIIMSALILLCFNDQYLPWVAIVFGSLMLAISVFFIQRKYIQV